MLEKAADPYGVPVLSSGEFDTLTVKHNLAQDLCEASGPVEILLLGDCGPSGEHMFTALSEDVAAMVTRFWVLI